MNVYDSGQMADMLYMLGYEPVDSPWKADLVIVNTCAIREKAVQKVMSSVGRLCGIKRRRPRMLIAVAGCVAQQQGRRICERFAGVDLVLGTRAIHRLPDHVRALENGCERIVDVEMTDRQAFDAAGGKGTEAVLAGPGTNREVRREAVSRYVTIMRGCDNFCAYCVVPYVRGRETSRPPEEIVEEARALVAAGAREITLLGQNVNSYGKKEGLDGFARLLDRVAEIDGLARIRFVTSHPRDLSDELVEAFGRIDKLCSHIHLPVQSGSNAVLRRMNRKYTRETYMARVDKLRSVRPDIAVTTDVIVGFPGEGRDDFEMTLDLLDRVGFDTLFAFEYSDRPQAPARKFDGKISSAEKKERLRELLDRQAEITARIYGALVGQTVEVLVEGASKRERNRAGVGAPGAAEMTGRTPENRIVNFEINDAACPGPPEALAGRILPVVIERACANSLKGKMPVDGPAMQDTSKGGKIHAA